MVEIFGISFLPQIPTEVFFIAIFIVIIIIVLKKYKKKEETYNEISLKKEIQEEIKDIMNTSGSTIFSEKRNLRIGFNMLGRITRVVSLNWHLEKSVDENLKDNKEIEKIRNEITNELDTPNKEFYLFEVIKNNLIGNLKYILGFGKKYFLVDSDYVENSPTDLKINSYAQFVRYFGDVYIFSKAGKLFLMNLADKLTLEQVLNEQVNFVPRMTFLEVRTAKFTQKARELADIEKQKYENKIENLEKED